MTATIRIPSHNIAYEVEDDAKALHCAVLLREQFPGVDIFVDLSDTPARDGSEVDQDAGAPVPRSSHESVTGGDDLEIPFFLRRTREQTISQ